MENLIIHISGASGSGKSTLGNKLKEHFKSKIVMKDLDELRNEFYGNKKWTYIDSYISKQKKPVIITYIFLKLKMF